MREHVRCRWRKLSAAEKCAHLALGKPAGSCSAYAVTLPTVLSRSHGKPPGVRKDRGLAPAFASGSGWPVPGPETSRSRQRRDRQLRTTQLSFLCDAFNIPQARPRSAGQQKSDLPVRSCPGVLRTSALSVLTAGFFVPPDVYPTLRSLQVSAPRATEVVPRRPLAFPSLAEIPMCEHRAERRRVAA